MALTDRHVYGIFLDNPYRSIFNMGQESEDYYYFGAVAGNLDYYFISGQLLAPVVNQGATKRLVYLPAGAWYDYWTGEKLFGENWIIRDAPIEVCPIYVRAGSVIPTMEPMDYVGEKEPETLVLEVFPGDGQCDHNVNTRSSRLRT